MQCGLQNFTDRHYNSIDLFKLIMAFMVVAIHTHPLENCTNSDLLKAYDLLAFMAVPYFFLASGYLLAIKMSWPCANNTDNANRLLKHTKRIIKMYLTWTAIYLPLAIYHFICSGTPPIKAILLYIRGLFFVGEQYNSWPLWYLLSTIYTLIVIYVLLYVKKKSTVPALILLSVFASVFSIGISHFVVYEGQMPAILQIVKKLICYSILNGRIFRGMIYIPIGMLLANRNTSFVVNLFVLFLGYVANDCTSNTIISSYALIVMAVALFGVVEKIKLRNNAIYPVMRNMSTVIYFTHMYIWTFYYTITYGKTTYGLDSFLVTSGIAVLLFFAVRFVRSRSIRIS